MNLETGMALSKFFGEKCWHKEGLAGYCSKCGSFLPGGDNLTKDGNRTFTTRDDMMDLYETLVKAGKWEGFINWVDLTQETSLEHNGDGHAWLFCLTHKEYQKRCQMVADFLGFKEEK